jgi:hypothetical protein
MAAKRPSKPTSKPVEPRPANRVGVTPRVDQDAFTVARFAILTGLDRHSLATRLAELKADPVGKVAQAATYSLRDLVRATIGGDIEAEKLRKTKEEADKLALANSRSRGELVEIAAVKRLGEKIMIALRNRILAMPLTDEEKDRCLVELMGLASLDWSRNE